MTIVKETQDRRTQTREMMNKWISERQQMLVLFCQLAGLEPYTPDKPVKKQLEDFCQVMIDYIAFGHFEVFDRISRGEERRVDVLTVAAEVYPRVTEVAEVVVAFNDKYDCADHEPPLEQLYDDLSQLGEKLAARIEMEDRIVSSMMA
ncbi:MAG: sigma D regulator [Chromatiales bacterium]|nr:sigma D regulator [Chromatiales bacterium]